MEASVTSAACVCGHRTVKSGTPVTVGHRPGSTPGGGCSAQGRHRPDDQELTTLSECYGTGKAALRGRGAKGVVVRSRSVSAQLT